MGLYTITTRAEGTVLTGFGSASNIFNVDHLNHVTHTAAEFLNSWEATLVEMQETHAPMSGAALSLPASLADEIERLRYQIARIRQQIAGAATPPFWYDASASFSNGVALAPTAARLERTAPLLIPSATITQVLFDTTTYDTASIHSLPAIIAPVNGVYVCGATFAFGDGVTNLANNFLLILRMKRGATNFDIVENQIESGVTAEAKILTVETVKHLNAGDIVKTMVYQNTGIAHLAFIDTLTRPAMWVSLLARD